MINIQKFLNENADTYFADFSKKIIKTKFRLYGVRIPILRKFAKQIEPEYIDLSPKVSYEEILLYGISASNMKSEDEQLEYLENVLPYLDDWSTCDVIVQSMKKLTGEKSYEFFKGLLKDEREFYCRVGVVGIMRYFLKTDKLDDALKAIHAVTNTAYYVQMAISWLFAELCSIYPERAKQEIAKINDKFIRNRAISKARESFRVRPQIKEELLKLKIAS